jgi:hypothetical protein
MKELNATLLAKSMELSPSSEANSHSDSEEIPSFL